MKQFAKAAAMLSVFVVAAFLLAFASPMQLDVAAADGSAAYTVINTAEELIALMNDSTRWSGNFRLGEDDIDLTGKDGQARIGDNTTAFTGIFDGNGKTIKGIDLTITGKTGSGLFGCLMNGEIRNLTVEGQVTDTTANFNGGLIGVITGSATVENCVNNITVTGRARVGGVVGGVALTNNSAIGTPYEAGNLCTVVIRNCVNNAAVTGSVTSDTRVGGIVGAVSPGISSERTILVENCTNNGTITGAARIGGVVGYSDPASGSALTIKGCTNTAAVTGTATSNTYVGGILGGTVPSTTGGYVDIIECRNSGTVKGPTKIGGIVGYAKKTKTTTVSKCFNSAEVTATGADCGGIVGIAYAIGVDNCINTGAVSGTESVGGIVGRTYTDSTYTNFVVESNYNAGTTTRVSGTKDTVKAVIGNYAGTGTATNNYYSAGTEDTNATLIAEADLADSMKYVGLDETFWTFTTTGPELTVFHEHTEPNEDGKCDTCGANLVCQHKNTTTETITAATCIEVGVGKKTCNDCGNVEEVELPLDPNNHAGALTLSVANDKVVYTCACGATYGMPVSDKVYVAASGVTFTTLPSAAAGTEANPFGDFDLAMKHAAAIASAKGAATVVIKDTATLPAAYATPTYSGMLTVTGGKMILAGKSSTFKLNGDLTFKDIEIASSTEATTAAADGAYIYAQNHKLVLDTGIRMVNATTLTTGNMSVNAVKMYVLGGFETRATVTQTLNTDVTIRSGDYWFVGGASRCWAGTMTLDGTTKLVVGKTNESDTLQIGTFNSFSVGKEYVGTKGLKATVTIDGDVDIVTSHPISQNGGGDGDRSLDLILKGNLNPNYRDSNGTDMVNLTGSTAVSGGTISLYVDERVDTAIADAGIYYGEGHDTSLDTLKTVVNRYTYIQYCLDYLNGHVDENADNACDTCGAPLACTHPEDALEYRITVPATCSAKGVKEAWCTACEEKAGDIEIDFDPAKHTGLHYVQNGEQYDLVCADCGVTAATLAQPVVYLDNWQKVGTGVGLTEEVGSDLELGTTAEAPVQTLEEAVKRLAATGGTVIFLDRYVLEDDTVLPAYEKEITFTAGETNTGFALPKNVTLSLNGPTKFEKFIFNNGSYTLFFEGNWNDVTFGANITTYGKAYYIAGRHLPTTSDDTVRDIKLSFSRTTANKVSGTAMTFFNTVILGDRVQAPDVTVSNKTVTANFESTTAINVYAGSTSSEANNTQMVNCSTTMNLNEGAYIQVIRSGDANTAGNGTAYMDNVTININDYARVYGSFVPRNVRNLTVNISGTEGGRIVDIADTTKDRRIPKQFGKIDLSAGYLASDSYTGAETLTLNYTSHSFAAGVAAPTYSEMYAVTTNVTDECTWDEGEVTTAPGLGTTGTKTYTCSVCGATKTEEIPALHAVLTQKSISAAKDKATGESTMRFIAKLELAEDVTVEKIGMYIALVELGADGAPSQAGAKVVEKEQTVTDTAPETFALDLTGIPADQTGTNIYAWAFADLSNGTRVSFAFDAAAVDTLLAK